MSISYDRILWLPTEVGNTVCKMYELERTLFVHPLCMATCLQLGQSIISIITRVRLQQSTRFMGLVFHCHSIKCRKMMVLCVISIEGLSTSKPVHDLYPIITLMCHQSPLETKVHLYLLEL